MPFYLLQRAIDTPLLLQTSLFHRGLNILMVLELCSHITLVQQKHILDSFFLFVHLGFKNVIHVIVSAATWGAV